MTIQFYAKNIKLSPKTRKYIEEKLQKVIKYIGQKTKDVRGIHVDLSYSPQHKTEEKIRIEVNIDFYPGQKTLRATERARNIEEGINLVQEKLAKQIEKKVKK